MDLLCVTSASIGLMITAYYIGFVVGGFFCTFPDTYGRKKSCMLGLFMASTAMTVIIVSPNYWVRFAMFFLLGLSQIKNSVCYVWLSECTSKPHKASSFTYINMYDALTIVLTCAHFLFISKNWINVPLFFCGLSWLAFLLAFCCPESPRWHLV